MKALITGASGGIGRDIARVLAARGCELVLCARNEEKLREAAAELHVPVRIIALDISREENCFALYEMTKNDGIDILVNNAGFGVFGKFCEASLEEQINLIDLNIRSLHILMQLFLKDFRNRGNGYIMNVSSVAGFFAGPLMAGYYASKNYVTRLSEAVAEELRSEGSRVKISVLCPGPVKTGFNSRAGVKVNLHSADSYTTAQAAVRGMFAGKLLVTPSFAYRVLVFLSRFIPRATATRLVYFLQRKKGAL
jgi:short-subunit dehydrogenase